MKLLSIIIFASILIVFSQAKLVYLFQLSASGAKYPADNFLNKQHVKGQLTGVGMRQHYLLGTYLYNDYLEGENLLQGTLNAREAQIYSSSSKKAIHSTYSQLYGLFPTFKSHKIPSNYSIQLTKPPFQLQDNLKRQSQNYHDHNYALNLGFQPPTIIIDDTLLKGCQNYDILRQKRFKQIQQQLNSFKNQHKQFIKRLQKMFNVSILKQNSKQISQLYDNMISAVYLGQNISDNNEKDLKYLKFMSDYQRMLIQGNDFVQILSTPMIRFIVDRLNDISNWINQKKLSIFMGDKQNILQMQYILNMTSKQCIQKRWNNEQINELNCMEIGEFASNILIQVHARQQLFGFDVRVKYNGQYVNICDKQKKQCDLQQFVQRISMSINKDYNKQCGIVGDNKYKISKHQLLNEQSKKLLDQLFDI